PRTGEAPDWFERPAVRESRGEYMGAGAFEDVRDREGRVSRGDPERPGRRPDHGAGAASLGAEAAGLAAEAADPGAATDPGAGAAAGFGPGAAEPGPGPAAPWPGPRGGAGAVRSDETVTPPPPPGPAWPTDAVPGRRPAPDRRPIWFLAAAAAVILVGGAVA